MCLYNKLISLLFGSLLLISCEDTMEPVQPVPASSTMNSSIHSFEASGRIDKLSSLPVDYTPVITINVNYQGAGSSNIMPSISFEASHTEKAFKENEPWSLESGEFLITGNDGNSIFGRYIGQGSSASAGNSLSLSLTIEGGTGKFEAARGNLRATVDESFHSPAENSFKIEGSISLPDQSNN